MTNSLLASLDQQAADGAFPWWDNAKKLTLAMRALGVVAPKGPILVFCVAAYVPSEAALERSLYVFGAVDEPGRAARDWLGEKNAFESSVDRETILVESTGVRMQPSRGRATPAKVKPPRLEVRLGAKTYPLHAESSGVRPALRSRLSPSEVMAIALAKVAREELLSAPEDVLERLELSKSIKPLFVLEDWQHPSAADQRASTSKDIIEMCAALDANRVPRLIGKGNGSSGAWIAELVAARTEKNLGWGGTWNPNDGARSAEETQPTRPKSSRAPRASRASSQKPLAKKRR